MAMDQTDVRKYKDLFLKTAGEYIADMEKQAALLSENPQNTDAEQQLFIDSHSLSSDTNMMAYQSMEKFCKALNLAIRSKQGESTPLSAATITAIIEGVAQLRKSYNNLESSEQELDLSEAIKKLEDTAGVKVEE